MRRDLERPFPHDLSPEGVTFLPWTEERDGLMMQAFHAGFQDRWGERPLTTPEDWRRYYTGVTTFCPELSLIAMNDSKPVGMARVLINDVENKRNPHPEGEIGHIGVDPDYRRQGIASALMYQIMAGLKVRDLAYVMLTVDAKNERAIKTYGRVGFDTTKSYVRYRQDL
jgi:ribosomal protein S18 acetylase RimI-like enzyme